MTTTRRKPVILVDKPFPQSHTDYLAERCEIIWYLGNEEAAAARGKEVEAILWYGHHPL